MHPADHSHTDVIRPRLEAGCAHRLYHPGRVGPDPRCELYRSVAGFECYLHVKDAFQAPQPSVEGVGSRPTSHAAGADPHLFYLRPSRRCAHDQSRSE